MDDEQAAFIFTELHDTKVAYDALWDEALHLIGLHAKTPYPARGVMTDLLPCPFCGWTEHAVAHSGPSSYLWTFAVMCRKCGALGPSRSDRTRKRDAIRRARIAWNRRVK